MTDNGGTTAIARVEHFTDKQIQILKDTICRGSTDQELELFVETSRRTGLNPFFRQIFAVKRWDDNAHRDVMAIQVSIDGFRLIAQRSGKYVGQIGPYWCGPDGKWVDVWLADSPPAAARVGVLHSDMKEPLYAVARWASYAQRKRDGSVTRMWSRMPDLMLGKCAEALALRKAFPAETSGLYVQEEMAQADEEPRTVEARAAEPEPDELTPREADLARAIEELAQTKGNTSTRAAALASLERALGPTFSGVARMTELERIHAKLLGWVEKNNAAAAVEKAGTVPDSHVSAAAAPLAKAMGVPEGHPLGPDPKIGLAENPKVDVGHATKAEIAAAEERKEVVEAVSQAVSPDRAGGEAPRNTSSPPATPSRVVPPFTGRVTQRELRAWLGPAGENQVRLLAELEELLAAEKLTAEPANQTAAFASLMVLGGLGQAWVEQLWRDVGGQVAVNRKTGKKEFVAIGAQAFSDFVHGTLRHASVAADSALGKALLAAQTPLPSETLGAAPEGF